MGEGGRQDAALQRWLAGLTDVQQASAAGLLFAAIEEGCSTPAAACRHAVQSLRLQIEEADAAQRPGLQRLERYLCSHPDGALRYAEACLLWASLTEEERAVLREESRKAFQAAQLERFKVKRAALAQESDR